MKTALKIIGITFLFLSCNGSEKTIVELKKEAYNKEIIYQTERADYHFDYQELIEYCKKEDNGEPNDFSFKDVIRYVESFPENPVLIPDTLGTKMEKESEVNFNESDSLIRIRDQEHPYAWVTEEIEWAIIKFAKKGNLRIYEKYTNSFADTIIVDKVEANWYGETNIHLKNDTMIFSALRWIR